MNAHVRKPSPESEWRKISLCSEVQLRRGGWRGVLDAIADLVTGVEPRVVEIVFWVYPASNIDVAMPMFSIRRPGREEP